MVKEVSGNTLVLIWHARGDYYAILCNHILVVTLYNSATECCWLSLQIRLAIYNISAFRVCHYYFYPACARAARGKAISSVRLSVSAKIARS